MLLLVFISVSYAAETMLTAKLINSKPLLQLGSESSSLWKLTEHITAETSFSEITLLTETINDNVHKFIREFQNKIGSIRVIDSKGCTALHSWTNVVIYHFTSNCSFPGSPKSWKPWSNYIIYFGDNSIDDLTTCLNWLINLWDNYRIYNAYAVTNKCLECVYTFDLISNRVVSLNITHGNTSFSKSMSNWNGLKFRLVVFQRLPSLVTVHNVLTGYDGDLLNSIAKYLNLSLAFFPVSDGQRYGFELSNGTWVGTLRDLIAKKADFTGNGHFVKWYNLTDLEFTHYVTAEQLCVVVPKAGKVPNFLALVKMLNFFGWVTFFSFYVCVGLVYSIYKRIGRNCLGRNFYQEHTAIQMYRIAVGAAIPYQPKFSSERLLLGGVLLVSLVLNNMFQGTLTTLISTELTYKDIDSIDELKDAKTEIWLSSKDLSNLFFEDESLRGLNVKLKDEQVMQSWRHFEKVGHVTRINIALGLYSIDKETFHHKKKPKHLVPQCLQTYFMAYFIHKGSPVAKAISQVISRSVEGGIVEKSIRDSRYRKLDGLKITFSSEDVKEAPAIVGVPLDLEDMSLAFIFLLIGLTLSFLTAIIESRKSFTKILTVFLKKLKRIQK